MSCCGGSRTNPNDIKPRTLPYGNPDLCRACGYSRRPDGYCWNARCLMSKEIATKAKLLPSALREPVLNIITTLAREDGPHDKLLSNFACHILDHQLLICTVSKQELIAQTRGTRVEPALEIEQLLPLWEMIRSSSNEARNHLLTVTGLGVA